MAALAAGLAATGAVAPALAAQPGHAQPATAKPKPSLSITSNKSSYRFGGSATITAHLGATHGSRTVYLYANAKGQKHFLVTKGVVSKHGLLSGKVKVSGNSVFTARYYGDAKDGHRTATITRPVSVKIATAIKHYYKHSAGVYYFHSKQSASYAGAVAPNKQGNTEHFVLQAKVGGHWKTEQSMGFTLNKQSAAGVTATGAAGYLFRIHASYGGDYHNAGATSDWTYLRF